jgi:1,4-alpha-glucan branching enzyme
MNFFSPEHRFGTPGELKHLIGTAHEQGIRMFMSVDHITAAQTTDSMPAERYLKAETGLFDYENVEVLRFLLGNLAYWMEEFGFDGFRFRAVEAMLYNHRGVTWPDKDPDNNDDYVKGENENNRRGIMYLQLATQLIRALGGPHGKTGSAGWNTARRLRYRQ